MFKKIKGNRGELVPESNEGLPDSHQPNGLCPRCGKQSSFEIRGSIPITFDYSTYLDHNDGTKSHETLDRVSVLMCRHCNQGISVIEETWVGDNPMREKRVGGVINYRGINWWPLPEVNLSSDVPIAISNVFNEATMTLSANCPRASVVMARRTLEAITVDKGETKGSLYKRLESLSKKGVLHPSLADWTTEIRLIGNKGAHFDPIENVNLKDAKDLISFVRELIRYLYELPAELDRRRNR